jgi:autotransporter-associated beta strand protein
VHGRVNLNGTHQSVAKVIIHSATTGTSRVFDSVGGGTLTANEFALYRSAASDAVSAVFAGSGFLRKTLHEGIETGTITMSAQHTYTGDTLVEKGTLSLIGSGSIDHSARILISAGAILDVTGRASAPVGALALGSAQILGGDGTLSGGVVVSGTLSPGASIGELSTGNQTWNGGGVYEWEIASATGTAGTDWDSLAITGDLNIEATSEDRFTIEILPDDGITGFDNDSSYTWPIASVSGSVSGLDAGKFNIDDSAVTHDLAGGIFGVTAGGGGVNLTFAANPGPVAVPRNITRSKGTSVKIAIADLLAESTSHADGSARELVSVGLAAQGGVTTDGAFIYYTPANDEDDSFTFTVRDVRDYREGDTVRTAQSSINITVVNAVGTSKGVTVSEGTATVSFAGIPGYTYDVQRSTDLETWVTVDTIVAPGNGLFEFVDDFSDLGEAPASAFYRLAQP